MRAALARADRRWVLAVLALVLVVAVNLLLDGPDVVDGPRSSSYATDATGTAALAALLDRKGHDVRRLRSRLEDRPPPAGVTTFVLDPVRLGAEESAALADVVRAGGRVVGAGRGVERLASDLRAGAPAPAPVESPRLQVAAPAPETAGIAEVRTAGERGWVAAGGGLPLLAGEDSFGAIAVDGPARAGGRAGRLLLLADAGPLQNRLLDAADNADFALALAGPPGGTVVFVESVHGYEEATGLAAIPGRWVLAVLGLAAAAGLFGWARGRRLGPPELARRELDPPRRAYVEALAASLVRTPDRASAAAPVRDAARATLARRAGLAPDADAAAVARAAERLGLPADEVRALTAEDTPDLLATGRAHARLHPGRTT